VWSRWKREHDAIHIECWVVAEYPPSPDRLERPLPAKMLRLADSYSLHRCNLRVTIVCRRHRRRRAIPPKTAAIPERQGRQNNRGAGQRIYGTGHNDKQLLRPA
jgi:hypothetical protein